MGRLAKGVLKNKVENLVSDVVKYLNDKFDKANSLEKQIMIQLTKSITSIGANLNEADGALSDKDFYRIVWIAFREAKESFYWLYLLEKIWKEEVKNYIHQLNEIINMLATILKKSKK